ncbi:transcription termination factor NusA [Spirochaeta africana]|uniref:Transcription termination/antitermination protein NusA n=1 Tax=Spirochaeta africana (strain ATCC 700263 / DSM 8902 / Z-7692) TaxID=889378 RepID=H9UJA7_SPIAZ|nr:transcription termination factor NusA [Spirochaeta africana]AFG37600.1 transcription termination factor NusA [Spirochaeta africana DSM 8902]
MAAGLADAIRLIVQDKGISEDLVRHTIEEFLYAAYKRTFDTVENAVVRFSDDGAEVSLFAQKKIVPDDDLDDPVMEIPLSEALQLNEECEIGDELLIEINPQEFDRSAIQSAKQKAKQTMRDIQKDTLYSEFKEKEGEMIIGYYQRERNGTIFVDLGKTEGIMPKRYQSPREAYRQNDRIKALIFEVVKATHGLQIVLSRTHPEFVKRIFELEVPEVYDKTVEIMKIVREPGYRTKIAVYSHREDVDPVGACVGVKGVRIQAIVRELEGEKIDILKYSPDPREYIRNALSPAEVEQVVVLDEGKRQALAIVPDNQLSVAIGKQGLNVRLANRLVDWNVDVKTPEQFAEMDISAESKRAVSALFGDYDQEQEEITQIRELPGIAPRLVDILEEHGNIYIEDLVALSEEDLQAIEGLSDSDVADLQRIVAENVEIVEDEYDYDEEDDQDDEYYDDDEYEEDDEADATDQDEQDEEDDEESEEIQHISELPGVPEHVINALVEAGIDDIVELIDVITTRAEELEDIEGISADDIKQLNEIIADAVEIIDEDEES